MMISLDYIKYMKLKIDFVWFWRRKIEVHGDTKNEETVSDLPIQVTKAEDSKIKTNQCATKRYFKVIIVHSVVNSAKVGGIENL